MKETDKEKAVEEIMLEMVKGWNANQKIIIRKKRY